MSQPRVGTQGKSAALEFARQYVDHLISVLQRLDCEAVANVIDLFIETRTRGNTIFLLGNGGSAATSDHFANDLGFCASPEGHKAFRAVSLTSNSAVLTCLANDIGYENVFVWQLRNLMRPGDVVVGISASGNSSNAVKALEYAAGNGGIPVAIVGFDGGRMKSLARYSIHVPTEKGEYGPVEDIHMVLDHLISNYLASVAE
ncbi:MAG: SIS domain-containing protein [Deltaproteobacteria bacterium]|nr:SIS domain-containing protein [Deltaproteobacteria bacterium]